MNITTAKRNNSYGPKMTFMQFRKSREVFRNPFECRRRIVDRCKGRSVFPMAIDDARFGQFDRDNAVIEAANHL